MISPDKIMVAIFIVVAIVVGVETARRINATYPCSLCEKDTMIRKAVVSNDKGIGFIVCDECIMKAVKKEVAKKAAEYLNSSSKTP